MSAALLQDAVRKAVDTAIETVKVQSAGTAVRPGDAATDLATRVMMRQGIDLSSHRATALSRDVAEWADLILTMTKSHKETVVRKTPSAADKVFTICEYAGIDGEIEDPLIKSTKEAYERCAEQLVALTPRILSRLRSS